ncbi:hypothetical protein [Providencia stuartii]|uniref:hypothetical protein n=1 Tax=Providencia stuartii TaxID=588 RepID=UPI0024AA154D|nr:hypothetical protein [Providencia stuartii]MCX3071344.1 hypothetical protein [Providencia stuartii]
MTRPQAGLSMGLVKPNGRRGFYLKPSLYERLPDVWLAMLPRRGEGPVLPGWCVG